MPRKKALTSDTSQKTFPTRLRELMEKGKITQPQLAAAVGVQRQTISNYTCGQSSPDWETLVRIAEFFDVSSDYLIGLSDSDSSDPGIRYVCEYTGLSSSAVEVLHKATVFPWDIPAVDDFSRFLIGYYDSFLSCLHDLRNSVRMAKNELDLEFSDRNRESQIELAQSDLQKELFVFSDLCRRIPNFLYNCESVLNLMEEELRKYDEALYQEYLKNKDKY